jgi:hypothetical protein
MWVVVKGIAALSPCRLNFMYKSIYFFVFRSLLCRVFIFTSQKSENDHYYR